MEHSFDIDIAKKYGIEAAIILKNLYFWTEKNRANDKHIYDGMVWTYNSVKAFAELFPYMSSKKISGTLQKLQDAGLIVTGNYNQNPYDRTKWYAITKMGYSIFQNGQMYIFQNWQMNLPETENGFTETGECTFPQTGEPIPYINTDKNNTDINTDKNTDSKKVRKTKKQNTFDKLIDEYANGNEEIKDLLQEWLKVRKAKRAAMTDRAISMNLNKLDKLAAESGMTVPEYLGEVICRGWAAFYKINNYGKSGNGYQPPRHTSDRLIDMIDQGVFDE